MSFGNNKWAYLMILSIIWGSSYILIKKALVGFTPIQLGTIRIVLSTIFLLAIGYRSLKGIPRHKWGWIAASAAVGTFFPVFLFSYAETEIDSSVASILNSLVPLFTILVGFVAFQITFTQNQLFGVLVGLVGAVLLVFEGASINPDQNYYYAGLVLIAGVLYAMNANIIKKYLQDVSPMGIALGNFTVMVIPALIILAFSGVEKLDVTDEKVMASFGYLCLLAVLGTGIAKVMFNRLIHISTAVFASSVTYLIPIVGIFWGILDSEKFTWIQCLGSFIILVGVYLVNKIKRAIQPASSN